MTMRIAYKSVGLKAATRVFSGRGKVTDIDAVVGVRISRIVDGPLDYYLVEGPNVVSGSVEIPTSNVAGAVRAPLPTVAGKGGKPKEVEE